MARIDDTRSLTEIRYVSDIHIELAGDGYAIVKTGVLTAAGFLETVQPHQQVPLANAAPGALGTAVGALMTRLALDPATTTLRQLIRAAVSEAMEAQAAPPAA